MFRSAVYHENSLVGEADVTPKDPNIGAWVREIRVSHFSPPSDRCPPLAVLHTIAPGGPRLKMEARLPSPGGEPPPLIFSLYAACLQENKTAVVLLGQEELHLVAMTSQESPIQYSCFWGFTVVPGLYDSCVVMLNLRCLGIVFDLDETLVVANTMRSFEDKIDAIQRKINNEADPQRINAMLAEIKRYQDDKSILKQYIENDQIVENGKVFEVKSEVIPPLSGNHQLITRPIIRLQEKNIILTRINPAIRDTSVLVRLRPAWEELRSYLTARGRKRFEVYVCTMAERDYALEMWRLLDPEANLINSRELLNRIVCVKSGSRKSLLGVFQDGICHPKMALVIDDRLKVWEEQDQPRVHVVPPFAPYYSPQAEANSSVPVLCVARNVACNVRGGFFKQFDEGLLPRLADVCFEDDMVNFPPSPDVANYLITEVQDDTVLNATKEPLGNEGMVDLEVERRLKDSNCGIQTIPLMANNINYGPISSLQHPIPSSGALSVTATQLVMPLSNNQGSQPIASSKALGQSGPLEPTLQGSPATEEGEVPESELDPDTRRRLLILQHGQDTRDPPLPLPPPPPPPFSVRPSPLQVSVPPVQPRGSWFPLEEEINPMHLKRTSKKFPLEPESMRFDSNRPQHPSFFRSAENFIPSNNVLHENQRLPVQVQHGDDRLRPLSDYHSFPGEKIPMAWGSSNYKDMNIECSRATAPYIKPPAAALYDISTKLGAKVEFRSKLCDTIELRFSIEAWFLGEKIGEGIGRTRREAQHLASERAMRNLANKYLSRALRDPTLLEDTNKFPHTKENGFASDPNDFGYPSYTRDEPLPLTSTSDEGHFLDNKPEGSRKAAASVAALKELCLMEGYNLSFNVQSPPSMGSIGKEEVHAQVEIGGQIFGKGTGATWEEAKLRAAEEALVSLKPMVSQKRQDSPRSSPAAPSKRLKQDLSRVLQRQPSSSRYSNNETHVP